MKILRYLIVCILPIMFFSCDNFDDSEYLTPLIGEIDDTTPITKTQNKQAVLLEDYTGCGCTNCAKAASVLSDLANKYGDKLMAMGVHAGSFADPTWDSRFQDFRTEYGEKWNDQFGLTNYPSGVINRTKQDGKYPVQVDDWDAKITEALNNSTHYMNINLGAANRGSSFVVSVNVEAVQNVDFPTFINVLVLESGIVGLQMNNNSAYGTTPEIENFVFNHVLRPNGLVNMPLADKVDKGDKINRNYGINIDKRWVTSNCKVLVFVANASTGEVVQVNEVEVE